MPVLSISASDLRDALQAENDAQLRSWCAALEAGDVVYFAESPVPIPPADLALLRGQRQTGSRLHKNISYKPQNDVLGGVDARSAPAEVVQQLHAVMRGYSLRVTEFLGTFLGPYQKRWILDYASFRPIEEKGRDLSLRRRNDLLHVDAFPTRPTRGRRILRFFHNIHPERTRDWAVGDPFQKIVNEFVPGKLPVPRPDNGLARVGRGLVRAFHLGRLLPKWQRTPYDEFMMRLHNTMKEDSAFQSTCAREFVEFAPGSSWMVYTETVPHAVLAGKYALEQTFQVDPAATVTPESAPVSILERMAGAKLV
jgi:hypothetical protein